MRRLTLAAFAASVPVMGHEGEPLAPHDAWWAWSFDPVIVLGLVLSGWLYWRGDTPEHGIRRWERAAYWTGWVSLVVALVSPLHPMGEVLFSAHMAQHEILMLLSAPLIVLGRPLVAYMWALPPGWRRGAGAFAKWRATNLLWRWFTHPFNAWWIHALALWGWHAPLLFQATLRSDLVHSAQHLSFLISALLFWWALFRGREAHMGYGAGVFYIFTTAVHSGILGALLTFAPATWYPAYGETTQAWGLTPLEDQQIGGLIMWVPASLVFLAAGLGLLANWLEVSDRRSPRVVITRTMLLLCIALPPGSWIHAHSAIPSSKVFRC